MPRPQRAFDKSTQVEQRPASSHSLTTSFFAVPLVQSSMYVLGL